MASRTVESPAGEHIEIVPDDDWVTLTGCDPKGLRQWGGSVKRFAIADLWMGGEVTDPKSGRATAVLFERMRERFPTVDQWPAPTAFTMASADPINAAAFEKETRGKRTYRIKLIALPQMWYDKMLTLLDEHWIDDEDTSPILPDEVPTAEPPVAPTADDRAAAVLMESEVFPTPNDDEFQAIIDGIRLDAPTQYTDPSPPLEFSIASQVAMSLLTTCVEIIAAGSTVAVDEKVRALQNDLNDVMTKLSARLDDNDRLRRQLRTAGDEINALRHERDGLRSRLRATEANLTAALKGDAVQAVNAEIQKRVDAIMRVTPKAKGEE